MNKRNLLSEETKSEEFRTYRDTDSVKQSEHTPAWWDSSHHPTPNPASRMQALTDFPSSCSFLKARKSKILPWRSNLNRDWHLRGFKESNWFIRDHPKMAIISDMWGHAPRASSKLAGNSFLKYSMKPPIPNIRGFWVNSNHTRSQRKLKNTGSIFGLP